MLNRVLAIAFAVTCLAACEGPVTGPDDASERPDAGAQVSDTFVPRPDASLPDRCDEPLPATPSRILFVGNSFTFTARMPRTFEQLVAASGFPVPEVGVRAVGGQTLEGHRADTAVEGAPSIVGEGWDVVILQEFSTRPTDAIGDPEQFKEDATFFHDLALTAQPDAQVVLFETFARRASHPYYPGTFTNPADMQAQLRFHYEDCANNFIPEHSTVVMTHPVIVARVGDAWERVLEARELPPLHASDDYHPNANGAYLSALVFFSTLYGRSVEGLPALGIDEDIAIELQAHADAITGAARQAPSIECPRELAVGDTLAIDFGPNAVAGWASVDAIRETVGPLTSLGGERTDAQVSVSGFTGTQTGGSAVNTLGLPADVSADSLWVGSFDGHEAARGLTARIELTGLTSGAYALEFFASRDGDDGGNGRLTRYALGARTLDLEVSDNQSRTARLDAVTPDARGTIAIDVSVSPDGRARFAYAGVLRVTRQR